jgi:hypothetical protein
MMINIFKIKKLIPILAFIIASVQAASYADLFKKSASSLYLTSGDIYLLTKNTCKYLDENSFDIPSVFQNHLAFNVYSVQSFQKILDQVQDEAFQTAYYSFNYFGDSPTAEIVQSDIYFNLALTECFPKSIEARNYFKQQIADSVYKGKKIAALSQVLGFVAVSKAFGSIVGLSPRLSSIASKATAGSALLMGLSLMQSDTQQQPTTVSFSQLVNSKLSGIAKYEHGEINTGMQNLASGEDQMNKSNSNSISNSNSNSFMLQLIQFNQSQVQNLEARLKQQGQQQVALTKAEEVKIQELIIKKKILIQRAKAYLKSRNAMAAKNLE